MCVCICGDAFFFYKNIHVITTFVAHDKVWQFLVFTSRYLNDDIYDISLSNTVAFYCNYQYYCGLLVVASLNTSSSVTFLGPLIGLKFLFKASLFPRRNLPRESNSSLTNQERTAPLSATTEPIFFSGTVKGEFKAFMVAKTLVLTGDRP